MARPPEQKTTFVSDNVHGSILLSPCEKKLISTEAYNRLHNVLQNSLVYCTYPSNRTSRFIHSLGCLKVASEIFRCSLLNAEKSVQDNFFDKAREVLAELRNDTKFREDVTNHINTQVGQRELEKERISSLSCHLYSSVLIPGLDEKDSYVFVIFLQAVRFVALLHDIGHPPFSHVTEHAITDIYEILSSKLGDSPKAKELHTQFAAFFGRDKPFHEMLGLALSNFLLEQVVKDVLSSNNNDAGAQKRIYDLLIIKHLALAILTDRKFSQDSSFLVPALHEIVDGDLDADRMDYVYRDLVASGVSREPLRIDRLIQSFCLVECPHGESQKKFAFIPSARTLSNLEDFFYQRLQLYRYVIFHHRAGKFDALLERSIFALAQAHLEQIGIFAAKSKKKKAKKKTEATDDVLLRNDISGLWQVLNRDVLTYPAKFVDYYAQWDDSWLLTVLRKHYALLKRKRKSGAKKAILEIQLEELLSNRKQYHSLFKRAECFLEIDESFVQSFPVDFDWNQLSIASTSTSPDAASEGINKQIGFVKDHLSEAQELHRTGGKLTELVEKRGFFLTALRELLFSLGKSGDGEIPFADLAIEKFRAAFTEVEDCIFIPKQISPGISNSFLLANSDGGVVELGKVSSIADELSHSSKLFPPFFVYVFGDKINQENFPKLRSEFGRILSEAFVFWLQKKEQTSIIR